MASPQLIIDDSLIISRLQYKELLEIKPDMQINSQFFPLVTATNLEPFFDNSPLNLGLELLTIGNRIVKASIIRGYFEQNLEDNLAQRPLGQAITMLERLNFHAPIFYQTAMIVALNQLFDHEEREAKPYAIAMELARISHHARVLKDMLYCLHFTALAHLFENLAQLIDKPVALICRVYANEAPSHYSAAELLDIISQAQLVFDSVRASLIAEEKITSALTKKLFINQNYCGSMGLSGLYLRANRYNHDVRQHDVTHYKTAPVICVTEGGDAWARFQIRILEIKASLAWLKEQLHAWPNNKVPVVIESDQYPKVPKKAYACGEVEGPEGIIKINILANQHDHTLTYRIRSPAYFVAQAIQPLLRNTDTRDLPLWLYSLGISASEIDG